MVRVVTGNEPTIHRRPLGDELLIVLPVGGVGAVRVPAGQEDTTEWAVSRPPDDDDAGDDDDADDG